MESSNPCVWLLSKTKISFFLLPICTDELLSTPKIITFLPQSKFESEKSKLGSNPTSYPE